MAGVTEGCGGRALAPEVEAKLALKFANFKAAARVNKKKIEQERSDRIERGERFARIARDTPEATREAAKKSWFSLERMTLRLKRCARMRSTSDFQSLCVLGQGSFGIVYMVREKRTQEIFALKQMHKAAYEKKNSRDRAFAERALLGEASARWFVKLFHTFQDKNNVYMVMEFVQGGDLFSHLEKKGCFDEAETRFYMAELLEALDTVHRMGFIHRDVKPDNVMIGRDGHLKMIDFGLCKQKHDEAVPLSPVAKVATTRRGQQASCVGTPAYMSPEAFQGEFPPATDLWSWGCVAFECIYGSPPFTAGAEVDANEIAFIIRDQVLSHHFVFSSRMKKAKAKNLMPPLLEQLLLKVVCDQSQRLGVEQIREEPFFQCIDFDTLHLKKPPIVPEVESPEDASNFDRFPHKQLPQGTLHRRDTSLEWAHYEFDRKAFELQQPDVVPRLFGDLELQGSYGGIHSHSDGPSA